jgi:exopolysaccharide biosynthesis protein
LNFLLATSDSQKNPKMKYHISILLTLFTIYFGYGQDKYIFNQKLVYEDSISFVQIKTDSIFSSHQIISLLILKKSFYDKFSFEFGYNQSDLRTTSSFAKDENAVAAINGGFFDMDSKVSVTYFEINDTVISRTKGGLVDSIMNGAIIITNDFKIAIEPANSEQFYESSKQESAVLITGPLLLSNSEAMNLPKMKFVTNRHPRTCLCETNESVVFITIDGRNDEAQGMSLIESQKFLLSLGCVDAINLDGGGSTTMWIKNKGIVNFPSDMVGERPVSNALLIIKR